MGRILFIFLLIACSVTAKKKTNFVFFLVDDMGMMDLGTYGSTFHETPNIDNLAKTGIKFNYGYAACPVCSPTRASIMTGRHPVRVDITDWIPGSANRKKQQTDSPGRPGQSCPQRSNDCRGIKKPWLSNLLRRQMALRK
jgi:hypothetical protein